MTHTTDTRMPADALTLSPTELLACWEKLDLGEPPQRLRLTHPGPGHPHAEQLFHTGMTNLTRRGLATHSQPTPQLAELLRLIARCECQLDIRYTNPAGTHQPITALACLAPPQAVITVLPTGTGGPLQLWLTDSSRAATTLLGFLGDIQPGRGRPVNIPTDLFDQARHATTTNTIWGLADQLRARAIPATDASALAHMCHDATFAGQLGVTHRHHTPHASTIEQRGPWVIGFHRDHHGYYLQLRKAGILTITPTNRARLHRQWQLLIEQ